MLEEESLARQKEREADTSLIIKEIFDEEEEDSTEENCAKLVVQSNTALERKSISLDHSDGIDIIRKSLIKYRR